jgi:pimeloyl-ACP methyl ester carboxylesterase
VVRKRLGEGADPKIALDYREYIKLTLLRKPSTEYALFVLFDHYLFSKMPLDSENGLPSIDIPISLIYGDRDWMRKVGDHDVIKDNPFKGTHSLWHTLDNSDHNLFMDNPEGLVDLIFADLALINELETPWLELNQD